MKGLNFYVISATVVLRDYGKDLISLETEYPSPTPKADPESLSLSFEAEKDTGIDYVKNTFGITAEVIDTRIKHLIPKFSKDKS